MYRVDESIEKITVRAVSGQLQEGATAEIFTQVWAWSNDHTQDTADFYYAADATNPTWSLIGSVVPNGAQLQTLSVQYKLPLGTVQAVRVNFRYGGFQGGVEGTGGTCSGGDYDDVDDLAFAVSPAEPESIAAESTQFSKPRLIKEPPNRVINCYSLERNRCTADSSCRWKGERANTKKEMGGCQPNNFN